MTNMINKCCHFNVPVDFTCHLTHAHVDVINVEQFDSWHADCCPLNLIT